MRQLTRNTGAMLSSLFMPAILVVLAPVLAILASGTPGYRNFHVPPLTHRLPGFSNVSDAQGMFLLVMMPVLLVIANLLAPMLSAIHTLIVERERRSLELLLALPVLVDDILVAKLIAILATAVATILPMYLVDALVIMALTPAQASYLLAGLFLVVSTLVTSVGGSLLLALLARDLRSATALGAMLAAPALFVTAVCVVFVPDLAKFVVLGILLLALGFGAVYASVRWLTFERYVSSNDRGGQIGR